jgi:predicted nucleic acid-binding protein
VSSDLLLDTGVFIDHVRGARLIEPRGRRVWYSTITRAELFAGRNAPEQGLQEMLEPYDELSVGRQAAESGGLLRRLFGLSLPDAIIAATAVIHDLELVSRDRQFERIPGLRLRESL